MISTKTRLRYARGFLALDMFAEAKAELQPISAEGDAVLLLSGIEEREAERLTVNVVRPVLTFWPRR